MARGYWSNMARGHFCSNTFSHLRVYRRRCRSRYTCALNAEKSSLLLSHHSHRNIWFIYTETRTLKLPNQNKSSFLIWSDLSPNLLAHIHHLEISSVCFQRTLLHSWTLEFSELSNYFEPLLLQSLNPSLQTMSPMTKLLTFPDLKDLATYRIYGHKTKLLKIRSGR